jgi:hypothetical protein
MKIRIIKKNLIVDEVYNIAINDKLKYRITGRNFPFITSFSLYELNAQIPLLSIFRTFFSFLPEYKIYFNNEKLSARKEPLIFKTINYFTNIYQLEYDDDLYEFFVHKQLKYSIFKNGLQVAGFAQDRLNMLDEEGFSINCNNDSQKELYSAFVIILDTIYNSKISTLGGLINANTGVFWESKEYDKNWRSN